MTQLIRLHSHKSSNTTCILFLGTHWQHGAAYWGALVQLALLVGSRNFRKAFGTSVSLALGTSIFQQTDRELCKQ